MAFSVGDRIGGRYEVYAIAGGAGRSGMGTVYVCLDRQDGAAVALKTYQEGFFHDETLVDHFKRGALAWTELHRHPNVVGAHGVHAIDGRLFLELEYIAPDSERRNTLTHHLGESIALEQAFRWGFEFCDGMEHARGQGVTPHRDVKPDNLMIAHDGTLKVTDFDLAGLVDHDVPQAHVGGNGGHAEGLTFIQVPDGNWAIGTPPWMAPEQFRGATSVASDVYSFGVVLYQIAARGHLPFHAETSAGWAKAHAGEQPAPIDTPLWPIIEKCLAKRPADRFGGDAPERGFTELRGALAALWRREFSDTGVPEPSTGERLESHDHVNKGVSLSALGLHQQALGEFKRAAALRPDNALVYHNAGVTLARSGDLASAEKSYRKALKLDPESSETWNNYGVLLKNRGDLDDAEKAFGRAIALEPELVAAYRNIGVLLSESGRHDEAVSLMREAVARDPLSAGHQFSLGVVFENAGRPDEALTCYEEAVRLRPRDGSYHDALGNAWRLLGDMGQAVAHWKDAAALAPTLAMCRFNLAIAHERAGDHANAYRWYREAIDANPRTPNPYYNLGLLLARSDLYGEGAKMFERFVEHITPDLAEHEAQAREYVTSMQADEETIQAQIAEYPEAVYNRGNAYLNLGRLEEAKVWIERALAMRPDYANALTALGVCHERAGDYAESAACHRRAIEANPVDALPWNNLGWVRYLAGDHEQALEAYTRCLECAPPEETELVERANAMIEKIRTESASSTAAPASETDASTNSETPATDPANLASTFSDFDSMIDAFVSGDQDGGPSIVDDSPSRNGPPETGPAHAIHTMSEGRGSGHEPPGLSLVDDDPPDPRSPADDPTNPANILGSIDAMLDAFTASDPDGGLKLLAQMAQRTGTAEGYNLLGEEYASRGRFDEALDAFFAALERDPEDGRALLNIGRAFVGKGEYDSAVGHYQDLQAQYPGDPVLARHLGDAQRHGGDHTAAVANYRKALAANANDAAAHCHLGLSLDALGQRKEAMSAYRSAISLDATDPFAHYHLALALEAMGFSDLAADSFRVILDTSGAPPEWLARARAALDQGDAR